jgi:hypothetical protein
MKVVIVAFSKDRAASLELARGFTELGDEAIVLSDDHSDILSGLVSLGSYFPSKRVAARSDVVRREGGNKRILAQTLSLKPDLCFVVGGEDIAPETVVAINNAGIRTAAWITEEPANIEPRNPFRWLNFEPYSHIFAVDKLWAQSLQLFPIPKTYLPFGGFVPAEFSRMQKQDIDVLFVGDLFPRYPDTISGYGRRIILKKLLQANLISKAITPGFSKTDFLSPELGEYNAKIIDRDFTTDEMVSWYRRARIIVYIGSLLFKTDFDAALYRMIFEGAFVITDFRTNADKLWDSALPAVKSINELQEKIHWYLLNEDERKKTAEKLATIASARHTYAERARRIKEVLHIA